jgi:deazaflavin-dependent oxidoreductase (nitroreductase family)
MAGAIPRVDPEKTANSELKRRITAFALTNAGTWFSSQVGARIDPWLLRATRGRLDHTLGQIPIVLVTVRGARSGRERTVPLLYFTDGEDVVLIASSYGRAKFPAWYYNLKANPDVTLEAMGRSGPYVAHEAEGEDRDHLFELAKLVYSGYNQYEQRTAGIRRIPVMRLTPA